MMPLERLREKRYSQVICYPRCDSEELGRRLEELKKLGVWMVEFAGQKRAFDVPVLGKGHVGVVVAAHTGTGRVALKIRRMDADRPGMRHEREMLRRANAMGVGPRLIDATENFLLMEFIEGRLLPEWMEELTGRGTRARIHRVLRALLEQCWILDEAGLDHGELSRAPKHIIVDRDDNLWIVDFETASIARRVSNVTSICQYLFVGSRVAKTIKRKFGKINREELIEALRNYKHKRTREKFNKILNVCRLHSI